MKLMGLLFVAILFFTACEKGENHVPACVGLGDSTVFEIKYAHQKQLCNDKTACISFTKVITDSRCPSDAICVWQGEATIELGACDAKADAIQLQIYHPVEYMINGQKYTLELTALNPYPSLSHPIDVSEYIATITAKKR